GARQRVPVRASRTGSRVSSRRHRIHLRADAGRRLEWRDAYASAGYGHGHRVALLLENRPEFFFHYLALNALGVSIVPINPDYRHDELLYQMDHSEADLAVVISGRAPDLEQVARERSKPLPVVDVARASQGF